MKNKKSILLVLILMVVGFAAVSTTLYINGQTKINPNQDDFNVYFSDAYQNGKQDKSVIIDDTHIEFTTELSKLGDEYVLDYEVTNGSKNYDAELVMECTSGNEYLSVTNVFDTDTILPSLKDRMGKLTLRQIKSNAGEDVNVTIACTITANAVERESLGETNRSQISVDAVDSNDNNLNAKSYQILGEEEDLLLDSLVETGYVDDASEVDALIEVKSDDFEDFATTTFDVSSIAKEGDKVVILHFDEEKQEWEYISEEIVDENGEVTADFTSYSPVAFVVVTQDGTIEVKLVTVTYDANGGSVEELNKTIMYHKEIGELPTPIRTGYTFTGWYTKVETGELIESTSIIDDDMTIYAHWSVNSYDVILDTQSKGVTDVTSLKVPFNGSKTVTVTPNDGNYLSEISCTDGYTVSGYSTGLEYISKQTVTVKNNGTTSSGTCTFIFESTCPYEVGQVWNYNYTGGAQTFTNECNAIYKVELWGGKGTPVNAQGATRGGGLGTYVYGNIELEKGKTLNVYVGGAASGSTGGYNGGGNGTNNSGGGGGATDIRVDGTALANRIIVAGGGGGGPWFQFRPSDYSIDIETHEYGGEVTSVDTSSLGQGNPGRSGSYSYSGRTYTFASGGGGGGYYGGRSLAMISYSGQKAQHTWQSGGSSYINMSYFFNYANGVKSAITYSGTNGAVNFTTSNLVHYVQGGHGKVTITLVEVLG